jgi:hypothetical protein
MNLLSSQLLDRDTSRCVADLVRLIRSDRRRRVDPRRRRWGLLRRSAAHEALGVPRMRLVEYALACGDDVRVRP